MRNKKYSYTKPKIKDVDILENSKFINYLKEKRINSNMSQKDMAKSIGVDYNLYRKYEEGERKLLSKNLRKILKASGCNIITEDGEKII